MILNSMQQRVVASKKRITVITAQAGAGSSTALLLSLIEIAKSDKAGLVIFCRATSHQAVYQAESFAKQFPNARYSKESGILTIKSWTGKNVKIKFVASDYEFNDDYVAAVAFDHHVNANVLKKVIKIAGRVIINDWASDIPNGWGIETGLVVGEPGKFKFISEVENVSGLYADNPGVQGDYVKYLEGCRQSAPHLFNISL